MTLTQAWVPGFHAVHDGNVVTWSPCCEVFFYATFPVLLAWFRRLEDRQLTLLVRAAMAAALAAVAGEVAFGHDSYMYYCPLVWLPVFAAGLASAVRVQRGWLPRVRLDRAATLLLAGWLIAVLGGGLAPHCLKLDFVMFATLPGSVGLILACAAADLSGTPGRLASPRLVYLGELSFCFYLVHLLLLDTLFDPRVLGRTSLLVEGIVGVALATATAMLLHHGVERPAQRRLRNHAPHIVRPAPAFG